MAEEENREIAGEQGSGGEKAVSGKRRFVSIRSKMSAVVFASVLFSVATLMIISILAIRYLNDRDSDQLLEHLGRESAGNIDMKLGGIRDAVDGVYYYAYDQLESLFGKLYGEEFRRDYLERVGALALTNAMSSDHVETVYYRLTTDIKDDPRGFLYVRDAETGIFAPAELTDVAAYDSDDLSHVGWYYQPLKTKEPIWIGPYQNENLNFRMISYVVPVMVYGRFAGVIGMDIDIDKFCGELSEITVYNTGSAVLFDIEDNILFSRDYADGLDKANFNAAAGRLSEAKLLSLTLGKPVEYTAENGRMKLYAQTLMNGMTLCVIAPLSEINSTQHSVILFSILASLIIFVVTLFVTYLLINSFLKPLNELNEASKQLAAGNMDVHLSVNSEDEIGQLAKTFDLMAGSLKRYFDHFHNMAYTDALTGLNNKAAFNTTREVIESEVRMGRAKFAVVVMDVNNLKIINDTLGHERGDELLKHVTKCLRDTFVGFPLYRIGGDEFVSVINDGDPQDLIDRLQAVTAKESETDFPVFGVRYQIAAGAGVYDRRRDKSFDDVFNRADTAMYENKKFLKARAGQDPQPAAR